MMPETAMNENDRGVFSEYHVGLAGKTLAVEPKAKSHSEQTAAESKLEPSVLGTNRRHHSTSHFFAYRIRSLILLSKSCPRNHLIARAFCF